MSLDRFCRKSIATVSPSQTVSDAAHKMRTQHVGSVVAAVDGRPVGILTDRDIVCRVLAEDRDPTNTPVQAVMTSSVAVVHNDDLIDEALLAMREKGVRRLPIVDGQGLLVGMVSLDDLMVLLSSEFNEAAHAVRSNKGP